MTSKTEIFNQAQLKKELPDIRPGDTVKVHQKIKETAAKKGQESKERIQVFEGLILARKHGKGISATITVRKIISGVGVEKIFPIHSPSIDKIEIVKRGKVRRAKLYYLRKAKGKKARLKRKEFAEIIAEEEPRKEIIKEEKPKEEAKKQVKAEAKQEEKPEDKKETKNEEDKK